MNFKIEQHKFFKLEEKHGLITNLGNGDIEVCITDKSPIKNDSKNIVVVKNGSYSFKCEEGQNAYVRNIKYNTGEINVSNIVIEKAETIDTSEFVKKDGKKVLSDNNYTTRDKNKLSRLQENDGMKYHFYFCTETEYETLDRSSKNDVIYVIIKEETKEVRMSAK